MAKKLTTYRIFIASPSGLDAERVAFRDTIEEYNKSDAIPEDVQFEAVGWEDTLGGPRRPLEIITEELRQCDYLVMVLWDRWGSPPDKAGRYSSGTEEEFHVALECLADEDQPMRQVVMFFKGVPVRQLNDPGEELHKVLNFRKETEAKKEHLYQTFDEVDEFTKLLRRHLASWRRGAVAEGEPAIQAAGPTATEAPAGPAAAEVTEALDQADKLADEGKLTEAEAEYARLIVQTDSLDALNRYGHFLNRVGRLSQAQIMCERVAELADLRDDERSKAAAFGNLGLIYQTRGELDQAEEMHRKSLAIERRLGRQEEGMASNYGNLGLIYRARSDFDEAERMLRKSLEISERLGWQEGMANSYGNLGLTHQDRGELDQAEEMHRKALEIHEGLGLQEGMAADYGNLGMIYQQRGEPDKAEEMYRKALEIEERLGRQEGMASDYNNLGLLYEQRGELARAGDMLRKALATFERIGMGPEIAQVRENLTEVERATQVKSASPKTAKKAKKKVPKRAVKKSGKAKKRRR